MSAARTQAGSSGEALEKLEKRRELRLEREVFGRAVEVADGFWVLATRHQPGLAKKLFEINNRCLIFRVEDARGPSLLVVNAVDPQVIPEVHRIAAITRLPVRAIVSPGGGHHLLLPTWHPEFPEATILVPPLRIPRTANGKRLMTLPRVELMSLDDPLPQLRGQLDAVLFHGLVGIVDLPSPGEGGTEHGPFKAMYHMMFNVKDPVDELWLHHAASGTVIGGENLGWFYPTEKLKGEPFLVRQMVQPDRLWIQRVARKVADSAIVGECWKRVLAWPARAVMTYHDSPGTAFVGDGQAALRDAARAAGQIRDGSAQ